MTAIGIVSMALGITVGAASDSEFADSTGKVFFMAGAFLTFAGFVNFIWRVMP